MPCRVPTPLFSHREFRSAEHDDRVFFSLFRIKFRTHFFWTCTLLPTRRPTSPVVGKMMPWSNKKKQTKKKQTKTPKKNAGKNSKYILTAQIGNGTIQYTYLLRHSMISLPSLDHHQKSLFEEHLDCYEYDKHHSH